MSRDTIRANLQSSSQILAFNEMHIFFIWFETLPNLRKCQDEPCFDMLFISLFSFHSFSVLHLMFQSVHFEPLRAKLLRGRAVLLFSV